jgi:hypothetical protein
MLQKTKSVEKEMPKPSKLIADSSATGNKAGMKESVTQSDTGASSLCANNPPRIAWG